MCAYIDEVFKMPQNCHEFSSRHFRQAALLGRPRSLKEVYQVAAHTENLAVACKQQRIGGAVNSHNTGRLIPKMYCLTDNPWLQGL